MHVGNHFQSRLVALDTSLYAAVSCRWSTRWGATRRRPPGRLSCDPSGPRRRPSSVQLFGQEVDPGTRENLAVFWSDGQDRVAIINCGYGGGWEAIERVARRYFHARSLCGALRSKVLELAEPGGVITTVIDAHVLGLMRYVTFGEPAGGVPHIVCREERLAPGTRLAPTEPVLCPSVESAREFARAASKQSELPLKDWRAYRCGPVREGLWQAIEQATDGKQRLKSELEEALSASLAREREAVVRYGRRARRKQSLSTRRAA
jgi:hypothetical protein